MSEKKYKIAVCFSGQPRYVTEGAYWNHKNWIQPFRELGHEVDIFCHSWDTSWAHTSSKDGLKKYKENNDRPTYVKENRDLITKELVESHNPKAIRVDDFFETSKSALDTDSKIFGQHMSAILSNDLSKKYEEERSFKYDLKIRTRYDAITFSRRHHVKTFFQNTIPDLLEDEIIFIQGCWKWGHPTSKDAAWCIQDQFFLSCGYIIDEVMNMDHLLELRKDKVQGQNTLWFYLLDKAQWRVRQCNMPSRVIRQCIFDNNPDYKTWTEEQLIQSSKEWRRLLKGRGARARVGGKK